MSTQLQPSDSDVFCVYAALQSLALPLEDEVQLLIQIFKAFPNPGEIPPFMTRTGKQSRQLDIMDFVKPVKSAEERALYMELQCVHTRKKHADWLGFCRDFSLAVVNVWDHKKTLCNLYLKQEEHLKLHEKQIVLQASQAEVEIHRWQYMACQLQPHLFAKHLCSCSRLVLTRGLEVAVVQEEKMAQENVASATRTWGELLHLLVTIACGM